MIWHARNLPFRGGKQDGITIRQKKNSLCFSVSIGIQINFFDLICLHFPQKLKHKYLRKKYATKETTIHSFSHFWHAWDLPFGRKSGWDYKITKKEHRICKTYIFLGTETQVAEQNTQQKRPQFIRPFFGTHEPYLSGGKQVEITRRQKKREQHSFIFLFCQIAMHMDFMLLCQYRGTNYLFWSDTYIAILTFFSELETKIAGGQKKNTTKENTIHSCFHVWHFAMHLLVFMFYCILLSC